MTDNYYFKGCISGMVGILISHPVDSIKTHNQIQNNNKTSLRLGFKYNITNLYKGIMSPLVGVGLEKALVFGTYNYFKNITNNTPISGAISGFVASAIVSPYERIKIMKQTNQKILLADCFKPSFIFKGLSATLTREIPGFAIYFSTYEGLKNKFYNNKQIDIYSSFIFGGISGLTAWIFIYPQDRIKTILQSQNTNNTSINSSINIPSLIKNIYNSGGLRHFYKGFSFAAARAVLLHSGTFCTMELLSKTNN